MLHEVQNSCRQQLCLNQLQSSCAGVREHAEWLQLPEASMVCMKVIIMLRIRVSADPQRATCIMHHMRQIAHAAAGLAPVLSLSVQV